MLRKKALYGLKDAPRRHWYLTIDSYLGEIGFLPLKSDPCMYVCLGRFQTTYDEHRRRIQQRCRDFGFVRGRRDSDWGR